MNEYRSITTPEILHSDQNAVVEICLLRQHGSMQPFPWRKSGDFQKPWQQATSVLRRIMKTQKLSPAEVLYICYRYRINLSWDKIGLITWHVKNEYFEEENIQTRIDEFMKTHGNETLDSDKKIGRRNLLRRRSE